MTERLRLAGHATFRSFASRNFRLFFGGQLISQAGTWMQSVAITWLVLDLTGSGVALGLVTAAEFLPILVVGAWAGVIADRVDRHRLMLCTQSAFLVLATTLSVLTLTDRITVGALFALSLAFGIINAFDNPSRRALVVELVPETDVPNAVGLNSALMTGARVVGPTLAGLLIAGPGAGVCFVVNAVTYVAVIVALLRMNRARFRSSPRVARAKGQLREGLRYLWRTPQLRLPIILMAVIGTFAFNYPVTLPLLAQRSFHGSASTYTMLFATLSLGSVVGALVVARRSSVGLGFLVRSASGLTLATLALAAAPTLPLAVVATLAVGFCNVLMISGANTVVQLRAAPPMRGRVLALLTVVFLGSTPIGSPIIGAVAELTDVRVALLLGGLATGLATLWTARQMRALRRGSEPRPVSTDPVGTGVQPAAA
jgi:MFS family permease